MALSKSRSLARLIVVSAIFCIALDLAVQYGGIWQSQAQPAQGVEVTLSDGRTVMTGSLRRAWSKDWVLETSDGRQWRFQSYTAMRFQPPAQADSFRASSRWRAWLPAVAVVSAWLAWLLQALWFPLVSRRTAIHS